MYIHDLEIKVLRRPRNHVVGFAKFSINDELNLAFVAINENSNGELYLTYPKKLCQGFHQTVFCPRTNEASEAIENAVIQKYKEIVGNIKC